VVVASVVLVLVLLRRGALALGSSDTPDDQSEAASGRAIKRAAANRPNGQDPAVEPGTADVQEWDWLQEDLKLLLQRTRRTARDRLKPERFQTEYVGETVKYLKLHGANQKRFERAVDLALDDLERVRQDRSELQANWIEDRQSVNRYRTISYQLSDRQRKAARHLLVVLEREPRNQLLREQAVTWILRLYHGMRSARRSEQAAAREANRSDQAKKHLVRAERTTR
jgi:hypothetical protein